MPSTSDIHTLREAGLLSSRQMVSALWRTRDHRFWNLWANRLLLAMGCAHLLAGIVFFFAFNWNDIPPMARFAILAAAITASLTGALFTRRHAPVHQALLMVASVLAGVLLAVIGQVYQTGADAYELFAAWAVLILPWTLAGRSAALWACWAAVAYTAALLYSTQVIVPLALLNRIDAHLLTATIPLFALVGREIAVARGNAWLGDSWTRYLPGLLALGHIWVTATSAVFDRSPNAVPILVFACVLAAGWYVYRKRMVDFAATAALIAAGGLFLIAAGWRAVDAATDLILASDATTSTHLLLKFGTIAVWSIGVAGVLAKLLNKIRHQDGRKTA